MSYADAKAVQEHLEQNIGPIQERAEKSRRKVTATPFTWREPATIPPREKVYGRHFVRKFISGTLAPGGVGKSSQALVEAVAMASGRDLLGVPVKAPLRVWYWCGEDPIDEIERRVAAILIHYQITPEELGDRLFIDSGRECEIIIAHESKDGATINEPVIADLRETIDANAIDVWILDPFVSCHLVSENDNNKVGAIMKELAMLADGSNSCGELVHHVRKAAGGVETTVEDGRGAKAFSDRCRSVRTLNRMTEDEEQLFGLEAGSRTSLFRVDIGKANLFPAARSAVWRKLVSVGLGNGGDTMAEDLIGVVTKWEPPGLFCDMSHDDVRAVQDEIERLGDYRESPASPKWAGAAVGLVMDWDVKDTSTRRRVKEMLKAWVKSGLLVLRPGPDERRVTRMFVHVGRRHEG